MTATDPVLAQGADACDTASTVYDEGWKTCVATLYGVVADCQRDRGEWGYTCLRHVSCDSAIPEATYSNYMLEPQWCSWCYDSACDASTTVLNMSSGHCVASHARTISSCLDGWQAGP